MNAKEKQAVLESFDKVRANPGYPDVVRTVRDDQVIRLEGAFNYISFWDFPKEAARRVVEEQCGRFRRSGQKLLWRVYEHDKPDNLDTVLREAGFEPGPPETLMVLPLERELPPVPAMDISLVQSVGDFRDFLSVTAAAFGEMPPFDYDYFSRLMKAPGTKFLLVRVHGEAVAAARLEMPPESAFGFLFGGGVAPGYRGRGIYRALVQARAELAREQGIRYLSTEARETSRPILERLGFIPMVRAVIWTYTVK